MGFVIEGGGMVKVGFIGTGGIAQYHLSKLVNIKDVKLVAMCDVNEERAKKAGEDYKCPYYTDYKEMFKKEKMDACYICLPPFAHEEQETIACEKGINIFVEKPIALSMEKAKEVIEAIKKNKIVSAAGYQDRYLDIIDRLKQLLKGKKVGIVLGYWMGGFPMVYWWREKKLSGGQAVEQTTHIFDMMRNLFGEVEEVYAQGTSGIMNVKVEKCDIEDASAVTLKFKSELVATIFSADFLDYPGKAGLDIFCEGFSIEYQERKSIKIIEPGRHEFIAVANDPGMVENEIFIEAVKTGDASKIRSPYEDAAKSLEVTLAANESMKTGKPVKVPYFNIKEAFCKDILDK